MSPQRRNTSGPQDDQDYDRQQDREGVRHDRAEANAAGDDDFDRDLQNDNARRFAGDAADPSRHTPDVGATSDGTDQGEFPQHARRGQAQSPVEDTHYEPPHRQEGHGNRS